MRGIITMVHPKPPSENSDYVIFVDGSWRKPHYGAYAAIILKDDKEYACLSAPVFNCTINHVELLAIAKALGSFDKSVKVSVYSDSQYAVNCITRWMYAWLANGWMTSLGEPVKNKEVIEELYHLCRLHEVKVRWVRGHAGNKYNEKCDKIAQTITKAMVDKIILPPLV